MNKKLIKVTETDLHRIIKGSINKILNEEFSEIEDIPTFEVINDNISLSEISDILESYLYDKNDKFIGRLRDLHFKYDTNENHLLGLNPI